MSNPSIGPRACQNVGCREAAIGQMKLENGRKQWRCRSHWRRGKPPAAAIMPTNSENKA